MDDKGYKIRSEIVDYLVKELKFNDFHGTSTPYHVGVRQDMYAMLTLTNGNFMICVRESEGVKRSYDKNLLDVMNEEEVPEPNIVPNEYVDKIDVFSMLHELGHRYYQLTKEYENDYDNDVLKLQEEYACGMIGRTNYFKKYRHIPQERDADLFACKLMKNKSFMKKLCKYINKKNKNFLKFMFKVRK